MTLDREQIKAMRAADAVVLRFGEHTDLIDLSKEVERGDGFGKETRHVHIQTRVIVANYGSDAIFEDAEDKKLAPAVTGCWVLLSARFQAEWQTLARFVRTGDELVQEWVIDNRNGHIIRAGVTEHQLKVRVERPRANGRQEVFTFMLDSHAELANTSYGIVTRRAA